MSAAAVAAAPSATVRDQLADHLLTPQNSALIVIDYQPSQVASVRSIDHDLLTRNIVSTVKVARLFGLPIVHSTVNVSSGQQATTISPLAELLDGHPAIDRTTINAWEDPKFVAAVRATGRRKLVMCALWTEMCLAFPALDALREGFEVYPVTDAVGGTSAEAHRAALERVVKAGAQPITWVSFAGELQRDWARRETVPELVEVVINERLRKE
jgi:nicotinamidase-related amidase